MVNDFFTQDLFLARPFTGVKLARVGASRFTTGFANPAVVVRASKSMRVKLSETVAKPTDVPQVSKPAVSQVSKPAARSNYPCRALFVRPAGWEAGDGLARSRSLGPTDLCSSSKFLSLRPTQLKSAGLARPP